IVRRLQNGAAVGTVQATLRRTDGRMSAEVAWVIAGPYQRQGYAREAAVGMVDWLRQRGADILVAHIHPQHAASIGVATHLGLRPTNVIVDGEVRWVSLTGAARTP
ncbi:MAG: GNAT family N-acetyltransferase, partial [Jiangellaceae bacterium]